MTAKKSGSANSSGTGSQRGAKKRPPAGKKKAATPTERQAGVTPAGRQIDAGPECKAAKGPADATKARDELKARVEKRSAELRKTIAQLRKEIDERKKAEAALGESEEKFRTLAERLPNMIFVNKGGRVVYANAKCEELMGYARDEFCNPDFDFRRLIAPEYREVIEAAYVRHSRGEEVEPVEYALITKDGGRIEAILATKLMDYEGEKAILGIITDITERKRSREALRQSEARYRLIAENVTDVIWTGEIEGLAELVGTDARILVETDVDELLNTWQFTFISPSIAAVLGYEVHEGMRLKAKDVLTAASYLTLRQAFCEEVALERSGAGDPSRQRTLELEHVAKDGKCCWCETGMKFLRDDKGRITGVVGSTRDVTLRRDLQRAISAAATHEQQRIGQELHDGLGQELLGLGLMARGLQKTLEGKDAPEAGTAGELVRVASEAYDHVRAMVKGVRPVDVQAGGLTAALSDLADATQKLAGLRCTFECREDVSVVDDHAATQLFYIAREAVRNAVKHAGAKHIVIGLARCDRRLQLFISDDGRGLPAESDRTGGTGLRIMHYRAVLIGGTLAVEPAQGGGTLVTCAVPLEELG